MSVINNVVEGSVECGAPICLVKCKLNLEHSIILFRNNRGSQSGGITVRDKTELIFTDNTTLKFINNAGQMGGALSLYTGSPLVFPANKSNISITFINNTAQRGGAMYIEDCTQNGPISV